MGSYLSLFLEVKQAGLWRLVKPHTDLSPHQMPCLYWIRNHFSLMGLFASPAYFDGVSDGWPEDASIAIKPYAHPNAFVANTEALCLETWDSEKIYLSTRISAAQAQFFASGDRPWPDQRNNPSLAKFYPHHKSIPVKEKQVWSPGQLRNMSPERLIAVTWVETLTHIAEADFMEKVYRAGVLQFFKKTTRLIGIPD